MVFLRGLKALLNLGSVWSLPKLPKQRRGFHGLYVPLRQDISASSLLVNLFSKPDLHLAVPAV